VRKLPADIRFRRVPVAFNAAQQTLQRLFYAIEALGLTDTLHHKAFAAIHVQRMRFDKDADLAGFAGANGVDPAKLMDAVKSFGVDGKVREANQMLRAYQIDSVPMLTIHGRYRTSLGQAGGAMETLQVTEALVRKARRG
jgi:protein dithiol oxidoreductase (disulfide-forming)